MASDYKLTIFKVTALQYTQKPMFKAGKQHLLQITWHFELLVSN
jgi:hypothetical protein